MRLKALVVLLPVLMSAVPAPPLAARMHESWASATEARDRLIQGDLEGVRAAGAKLAQLGPDDEIPESWRPGVEAVRAVAVELSTAQDLSAAAVQIGRLGAACGGCHTTVEGGPDLEKADDLPPQRFEPGENMRLHAWATEWMWLGLVGSSDLAWDRGAGSLDDRPLDLRWDEKPPEKGRLELEQLVYVLASKALEVEDPPARAEVFGQLAATCAQCHITR